MMDASYHNYNYKIGFPMDSEEYDVLICGTGMAQCLLGATLAM